MLRKIVFSLLASVVSPAVLCGQFLDPSFNQTGYFQSTGFWQNGSSAAKVLIQPDGKVVAVGMVVDNVYTGIPAIQRFHSNGSPDLSFGVGGQYLLSNYSYLVNPIDAALQPDGKIVVVGLAQPGLIGFGFIARFQSNGFPDLTFSQDGIEFYSPVATTTYFKRVAVQSDGKIVVGGNITDDVHMSSLVARVDASGNIDPSFGITQPGYTYGNYTADYKGMNDLVLDNNQRILMVGDYYTAPGMNVVLAQRFLTTGEFDSTFAIAGEGFYDVNPVADDIGNALVISDSGDIFIAGYTSNFVPQAGLSPGDGIYLRLDSLGALNPAFAGTGKLMISIAGMTDVPVDLILQPDGKLVSVSYADDHPFGGGWYAPDFDFALFRLYQDGAIDSSFGTNGVFFQSLGFASDLPKSLAIQADGKLLVSGECESAGGQQFTVARFGFTSTGLIHDPVGDAMLALLFPNPAQEMVRVVLPAGELPEIIIFRDLSGKEIFSVANSDLISVSSLENGYYFLEIVKNGRRVSRKLLVAN